MDAFWREFRRGYMLGGYIGLVILCAVLMWLQFAPVQAAPVEASGIVMCGKIATTGPLDFYYCETDFGNFFVNSAGFMALEN